MGVYDFLDKYTSSALLQTALKAARNDVDKREGSIIYDALAPLAFVAANLFAELKGVACNTDFQTATGDFLDLAAAQYPVYRSQAVAAVRTAQAVPADAPITLGATFETKDGLNLTWTCTGAPDVDGVLTLTCDTPGAAGGSDYGELTPVEAVEGLEILNFKDTQTAGKDAESDEDFRVRIWREIQRETYGGNFADYIRWCFDKFEEAPNGGALTGISFFPAWNGGGTIKIVPYIADLETGENFIAPAQELLDALKAYLDPDQLDGRGAGVAPVGHSVTVEAPTIEDWTITATVTLRARQTSISDATRKAAEDELRETLDTARGAALTKATSDFPPLDGLKFNVSTSLIANAIQGEAINPRFADVTNIMVDGATFGGVNWSQLASEHKLARMAALILVIA